MRQMKMIQDWGYNYIYLCQPSATTCISLKAHSYKDVSYTLVRDMVSVIKKTDSLTSWLVHKEPVWLCEMIEEPDNSKEKLNDYICEPFPKHEFEPLGWNDTLATIDVCANIHTTKQCDKEGYDIISINMVKVIQEDEEMGSNSSHCDEELILEGQKMDPSKTMSIIQEETM